jgi:hypothetical protein
MMIQPKSNIIGVGWIIMAGSHHKIGKHKCCCILYHCFLSHMVYCCLVARGCHFDNMMAGGSSMLVVWMTIHYFHPQAKHGNMVSMLGVWMTLNYFHPQAKHGNMVSF